VESDSDTPNQFSRNNAETLFVSGPRVPRYFFYERLNFNFHLLESLGLVRELSHVVEAVEFNVEFEEAFLGFSFVWAA
jgi:hypothetical protein